MIHHNQLKNRIGTVLFYAVIFLFFVAPILRLIVMSCKGPDGYGLQNFLVLLHEPRTLKAIVNTLIIAVGSSCIATVVGTCMAFAIAYTNFRHKHLLEMLVLMPFIIPSYITTLSWAGIITKRGLINRAAAALGLGTINIYSIGGILFIVGVCNIPIVYLSVTHMLRKIPKDLEWASRSCGFSILKTFWKIDVPEAMPAIMSGAVLSFLAAIDNFSVPAFLGIPAGIPVLSTYIYEKAISFGPQAFPLAAALSVLLCVIAIGGTLLEVLDRKGGAMESIKEDFSPRVYIRESRRKAAEVILLLGWGLFDMIPLLVMVSNAFLKNYGLAITRQNLSVDNFAFVCTNTSVLSSISNSLILAIVTCTLCILIGTAMAYIKVRRGNHAVIIGEKCAAMTYAIPGIVLSLSMIFHWTEPLPGIHPGIYGTIHILVIAYLTRYLILQIKGSTTALLSVNPELEEAVRSSGGTFLMTWRYVLIPLLKKNVLSSSFLIFVSSLTELTLSSMLASADTKTIGLTIFNFQQGGEYSLSAAMSTLIVAMILVGYGIVNFSAVLKKEKIESEFVSGTRNAAIRDNAGA
jgi:iron(III) transport system permease protein